jgi:hypothetical protein
MRKLRVTIASVILALILSATALAGDMGAPGATEQPPPGQSQSLTGDMGAPGVASATEIAINPATDLVMNLLQIILTLF